jgi:hypothetical protein
MKTLEEQAQELANSREKLDKVYSMGLYYGFLEGSNSKWVQRQIIEAKLEGIQLAEDNMRGIGYRIMELEQQLKELEDENT